MKQTGDERLERAASGDQRALAALLEEHGAAIRRRLDGAISERWQSLLSVDDVLQQTYTDAFLAIGHFAGRDSASFLRWLTTLARRNLVDALRPLRAAKRGGDRTRVNVPGQADAHAALFEVVQATSGSPSRCFAKEEARARLLQAMADLPAAYRQVLQSVDLSGSSVADLAAALGRSEGAVHMLRARAYDRLREIMGSESRYFSDTA